MEVIKRDGSYQQFDISKIRKQTVPACEGLKNVSPEELELTLNAVVKDKIKTSEIQKALIESAMSKVAVDRPDWVFVAARLALYDLYHKIKHYHNKALNGNVYELVSLKDYLEFVYKLGLTKYSPKDFEEMGFDLEELNKVVIKNWKRDYQFTIMGINLFLKRYSLVNGDGNTVELPQHMFMHIAMILAIPEKDKNKWAKIFYDTLSKFEAMMATPTLSNLRKKFSNCFSCYVGSTPDNIEGIFDTYKEQALISKWGGGIGWDWSRIRALGGVIRGVRGRAKGVVPWLKIENDISIAVDQLGTRPGAINAYVATWTKDIWDFLNVKKSGGEERATCEDLFISIVADDVFMEQCEKDGDYYLFDPYDVPDLNEVYGDEFKKRYWEYVDAYENKTKEFTNEPQKIKARDLMRRIVVYMNDVGMPFWQFKDTVNKAHKHPEEGIIRSSNLCMEIQQPTDENRTALCNLASLNVAKVNTLEKIKKVVPVVIRMLDNVIEVTDYILDKHEAVEKRTRALGLGVMGEAQLVAEKQIMYGSEEHIDLVDELYKNIYSTAEEASKELAKEKGEWKHGKEMRNAYIGAIAPTSSISLLVGTTPSHEPIFKRMWYEDGIFGNIPVVAPNLNSDTYYYYVSAYDVSQKNMIRLTATRQKYVDQSISHNLYFKPDEITGKTIFNLIMFAWKSGLKTIYYTRTGSKQLEKESDKIACLGCE